MHPKALQRCPQQIVLHAVISLLEINKRPQIMAASENLDLSMKCRSANSCCSVDILGRKPAWQGALRPLSSVQLTIRLFRMAAYSLQRGSVMSSLLVFELHVCVLNAMPPPAASRNQLIKLILASNLFEELISTISQMTDDECSRRKE